MKKERKRENLPVIPSILNQEDLQREKRGEGGRRKKGRIANGSFGQIVFLFLLLPFSFPLLLFDSHLFCDKEVGFLIPRGKRNLNFFSFLQFLLTLASMKPCRPALHFCSFHSNFHFFVFFFVQLPRTPSCFSATLLLCSCFVQALTGKAGPKDEPFEQIKERHPVH